MSNIFGKSHLTSFLFLGVVSVVKEWWESVILVYVTLDMNLFLIWHTELEPFKSHYIFLLKKCFVCLIALVLMLIYCWVYFWNEVFQIYKYVLYIWQADLETKKKYFLKDEMIFIEYELECSEFMFLRHYMALCYLSLFLKFIIVEWIAHISEILAWISIVKVPFSIFFLFLFVFLTGFTVSVHSENKPKSSKLASEL